MVRTQIRSSSSVWVLGIGAIGALLGVLGSVLSMQLISYQRSNFAAFMREGLPAHLELVKTVIPWLMLIGAAMIVGAVVLYVVGLIDRRRLRR